MLSEFCQAIGESVKRLFGLDTPSYRDRRRAALAIQVETPQNNLPPLGDTDCEFLFMQLLEGVTYSWQTERVEKFLADLQGRITDEQWNNWLRRFGERLLSSPAPNTEIAARMVRLGEVYSGELGNTAYEMGMELLMRESRQNPTIQTIGPNEFAPPPPPVEQPDNLEGQPVTLEELMELLQQDETLVQEIAAQLQINTTDPQEIIQALVNKSTVIQSANDGEAWFNLGVQQQSVGEYEAAISSYDRSLEIDPHASAVWSNRGVALADLGRYDEAIACFEQVLQLSPTEHWAWTNRGYALVGLGRYPEAIKSFQEGLKYVQPKEQPEGWSQNHRAIGNAYYNQAQTQPDPQNYWRKAIAEYKQALNNITPDLFPQTYLLLLQDLLAAHLNLGQVAQAQPIATQGLELLQQLIQQEKEIGIAGTPVLIKFISFYQLTVDLAISDGEITRSLELAEKYKNACYSWYLDTWTDELSTPTWGEMQPLLNPSTAIIYWHYSPASLNTFILKHNAPEPILLTPLSSTNSEIPRSVQQRLEFEKWLQDWDKSYEQYSQLNPTWKDKLIDQFKALASLLNLAEALKQIPKEVTHLILIGHRDLHRLPLHALFLERFTVSYLPSAQIGLTLQRLRQISPALSSSQTPFLISVESPHREGEDTQQFAKIEAAGVTKLFNNSTRLSDTFANRQQVMAALSSGYNLLHFTGRSGDNFRTPNQSGLILTNPDRITLDDICQLPLYNYRLVCLSAGEIFTTANKTVTAESVGLVSAFLSRGVSNVICTLWTVEAISRPLLTIEFYRRFKQGIPPATALRQAQEWICTVTYKELVQWYRDLAAQLNAIAPSISQYLETQAHQIQSDPAKMSNSQPPFAHPYYWAAFTSTGI